MCVNFFLLGLSRYIMDDISYLHDQVVRQSNYMDPNSLTFYSQYMYCSNKTFSDMIEYNMQC